ncbi:hypothetical protein GOB94_14060 [Granulicella sp. 5B5]|uniref:phage head completion protein n=1 Tax=Granulicella sp. 5B5 TaxID=1617967 RepID=UPI0015F68FF7|nr:head-tail adaptor protein [Granulicella sp. 5B5]QMV19690.1 hypothetical protein GOB94_14060 [Granulicella sp. 5B5]
MARWPYPFQNISNPDIIPPGMLRSQAQVQTKSSTQTGTGSQQSSWTTALTCMCAVMALTPKESFQDGQYISQVVSRISIYWPGTSVILTAGMQVLLSTVGMPVRTLTVQSVVPVAPRNRVIDLYCIEINGVQ